MGDNAEQVARAVGAKDPEPLIINGKSCHVRPLTIRELTELQRECLRQYKHNYLADYRAGLEAAGVNGQEFRDLILTEVKAVARWDLKNLPTKDGYDADRIVVTPELKAHFKDIHNIVEVPEHDVTHEDGRVDRIPAFPSEENWRHFIRAALDSGSLTVVEYEAMSGVRAPRIRIAYDSWWITGCLEGMLELSAACFKQDGVTREDLEKDLVSQFAKVVKTTVAIERLTAPSLGNG